jgi:hypothetical protein
VHLYESRDDGSCILLGNADVHGYVHDDMDDPDDAEELLMDLDDLMRIHSESEFLTEIVAFLTKYGDVFKEMAVKSVTEE